MHSLHVNKNDTQKIISHKIEKCLSARRSLIFSKLFLQLSSSRICPSHRLILIASWIVAKSAIKTRMRGTQERDIRRAKQSAVPFSWPEETLLKGGRTCGRELLSGPPALRVSRTSPETAKYAPGIGKLNLRTSSFGSVSTLKHVAVFRDLSQPISRRRFRCEI